MPSDSKKKRDAKRKEGSKSSVSNGTQSNNGSITIKPNISVNESSLTVEGNFLFFLDVAFIHASIFLNYDFV